MSLSIEVVKARDDSTLPSDLSLPDNSPSMYGLTPGGAGIPGSPVTDLHGLSKFLPAILPLAGIFQISSKSEAGQ